MTDQEQAFVEEIRRVSEVIGWEAEARALVRQYVDGAPVTVSALVSCIDRVLAALGRSRGTATRAR